MEVAAEAAGRPPAGTLREGEGGTGAGCGCLHPSMAAAFLLSLRLDGAWKEVVGEDLPRFWVRARSAGAGPREQPKARTRRRPGLFLPT
jgi:hypothetical protein